MEINATLFGQMLTFAIFVWFTMKFVWPMLESTLKERKEKIASGLMAAERGHKELEVAQKYAVNHIRETHEKAKQMLAEANKQANSIVEEAKQAALLEKQNIITSGRAEIEKETTEARQKLQGEVVNLVVRTTEKLLQRSLTDADQKALLELKKADLS